MLSYVNKSENFSRKISKKIKPGFYPRLIMFASAITNYTSSASQRWHFEERRLCPILPGCRCQNSRSLRQSRCRRLSTNPPPSETELPRDTIHFGLALARGVQQHAVFFHADIPLQQGRCDLIFGWLRVGRFRKVRQIEALLQLGITAGVDNNQMRG